MTNPEVEKTVSATDDSRGETRLVIHYNTNLNWSKGKMAAHAVHAALKLYGIEYDHPVIVLGGSPAKILAQDVYVRDEGITELVPGTLTTGASWEQKSTSTPTTATPTPSPTGNPEGTTKDAAATRA